ncbi:MAG TPA: cellulase family glycosylhydrolase [Kofleriaceae bacterium]|nr:cellulase family glycosylhydrolase [Kofleriaceae bacterium]
MRESGLGPRASGLGLIVIAACGGQPEAPRCAIERPAQTKLHLDGTVLRDDYGRAISLRGVNAGGRAKFAPYAPFEFTDDYDARLNAYLDRAATWGIDLLRVTYSWQAAEPMSGAPDEAYMQRFDALLDGAAARGLWTIVDFHQDIYAEGFCGDGFPDWTVAGAPAPHHDCENWSNAYDSDLNVRAAFDAFWAPGGDVMSRYRSMWSALAAREASRAGVIGLEPINEPHPGSADRETWEKDTLAPFYEDFAKTTDALVFVDTTGYEGVLGSTGLPRPAGANIVLAPHSYDARALFGGKPAEDVTGRLQPWKDLGAQWNVPVVIGEMGIPVDNPFAAVHAQRHMQALDALGIGGAWWEYSVASELWNGEHFSIVNPDGSETAIVDELARPYARALAGTPLSTTYDPASRRFTISFTPSGNAPTELAAPSRTASWHVEATGACIDEQPGTILVRPLDGATEVSVSVE